MKQMLCSLFMFCSVLAILPGCSDRGDPARHRTNPEPGSPTPPVAELVRVPHATLSEKKHFQAELVWESTLPISNRPENVLVSLFDRKGNPAERVEDVTFFPWMTSMGHPTASGDEGVVEAVSGTTHQFRVTGVDFTMPGPWDIELSARINGEASDMAKVPVEVQEDDS